MTYTFNFTKVIVLSALLSALPTNAIAENLAEIYQLAAQAHPKLKMAEMDVLISEEQRRQSYSQLLPSVDLEASAQKSEQNDRFDKYELKLRQPLFDIEAWYQAEQSKSAIDKARLNLPVVKRELMLSVAKNFIKGMIAKQQKNLAAEQLNQAEHQLKKSKLNFDLGIGSSVDVQKAKSEWFSNQAELIEAENNYKTHLTALSYFCGVRIDHLNVEQNRTSSVGEPVNQNNSLEALEHLDSVIEAKSEALYQQALQDSSKRKIIESSLEENQQALKSKRGQYWPNLDLTGSLIRQENHGVDDNNLRISNDKTVGLELSWNLYQGGNTMAQVEELNLKISKTYQEREDSDLILKENIRTTVSEIYNLHQQYQALKHAIIFKEKAYQEMEKKWQLGMENFSSVQTEKVALFAQQKRLIEINFNTWLKFFELKGFIGSLSENDLATMSTNALDIQL